MKRHPWNIAQSFLTIDVLPSRSASNGSAKTAVAIVHSCYASASHLPTTEASAEFIPQLQRLNSSRNFPRHSCEPHTNLVRLPTPKLVSNPSPPDPPRPPQAALIPPLKIHPSRHFRRPVPTDITTTSLHHHIRYCFWPAYPPLLEHAITLHPFREAELRAPPNVGFRADFYGQRLDAVVKQGVDVG